MSRMLERGFFSDLVLHVGPTKYCFNVHKMVLGGRSEVFSTMLQSRWMDQGDSASYSDEKQVLSLPNHSVDSFRTFLRVTS